jgi:hypothetical protein
LPSDPLEDILAFFDKTPSGEVTSTGRSPVTTTDGDPITTGVPTSGGGADEPGATGADDISGSRVGTTGPGTKAGITDTTGGGASPTTGTEASMDTYIPYYTADGVVDVFVGTPGEFADLATANNWTAITSMGTDSTVGVGGSGGEAAAVGGSVGDVAGGNVGDVTGTGGTATVGDVAGGAGGAGGEATVGDVEATIGDVEATIGDVTGGTATVGDVAGGTATVGDVAGGAGGAATITGTVGGAGGTGGSSTVEIGPTTIDINLLPPEIVDLLVDYYSDDDDDAVAPVEYTPAAYTFGEPTTYTPTQDLTYREPAITSPFDFARDLGYYTLSPEIADSYATKELQSYMPTYLQPIGEMTPEEIEASRGIRSIIGPRYPVQTQPIGYPFTTTPEEEAEALLPKG